MLSIAKHISLYYYFGMIYLGPHVSIAGSVALAPMRAASLGATGFALYTKNEKRWTAPPLTPEVISDFKKNLREAGFKPEQVLPHASYIINLASPSKETREKGLACFFSELERTEALGLRYLNFHPGSHLGSDLEDACARIASALDSWNERESTVIPVLENAAGQGTNIGGPFEELKRIIDKTKRPEKIGITIDTCHAFAYGYDPEKMWDELFTLVPRSALKGIHLNNSMFGQGSRKDRHAPIKNGMIAPEVLKAVASESRFENLPIILETPDSSLWQEEIDYLLGRNG
jgi:apurinic endonuclease (APN1)